MIEAAELYRPALSPTGMRAGLAWRLRAKSIEYPPAGLRAKSQSFGRLVLERITAVSSFAVLSELRDILSRDKFARRLSQIGFTAARVFADYLALVTITTPALIAPTILSDLADDAVLAAALGGGAALIVSGDAHLLILKSFHGIEIVTAAVAEVRINAGA